MGLRFLFIFCGCLSSSVLSSALRLFDFDESAVSSDCSSTASSLVLCFLRRLGFVLIIGFEVSFVSLNRRLSPSIIVVGCCCCRFTYRLRG